MPKVASRKYARRRRRRRRPYSRRRRYSRVPRPVLSGFPTKKLVKLRYVDTGINLDAPAGGMAYTVYRANSVYDPYQLTGGHQPMGYDQWAEIYNKYTVIGSKCTMIFHPTAASNLTPGRFGLMISSDTAGTSHYTTINNLLESKLVGSNHRMFGPYDSSAISKSSVVKTFSPRRFFGKADVVDGSANTAAVTTNPGNEAYYIPWVASIASGQDPSVATFTVQIDYIVQFSDPKNLDGS